MLRALALLAALLLAGCAAPASLSPASTEGAPARSLDAAPVYETGEWWTLKIVDGFTKKTKEVTRVVAGEEGDAWLVGMPSEAFDDELLALHIPGFGDVAKTDLSYQIHNDPFKMIEFPAKEGASWETNFEGGKMKVAIDKVDGSTAQISLTGNFRGSATYDASLGEFRSFAVDSYATIEVVDHGFGYKGAVTVPHKQTFVFNPVRVAGALSGGLQPAPPVESIAVKGDFTRISFVALIGTFANTPTSYYSEKITDPSGKTYEFATMPGQPAGFYMKGFRSDKPVGSWSFQHVAAGPGIVLAEGLAYEARDVTL
jgi:hypothetical protein